MVEFITADSVQIKWDEGDVITSNPAVIAYRIYLDDYSGNTPALVYDTGHRSLTNLVTISDLTVGM